MSNVFLPTVQGILGKVAGESLHNYHNPNRPVSVDYDDQKTGDCAR